MMHALYVLRFAKKQLSGLTVKKSSPYTVLTIIELRLALVCKSPILSRYVHTVKVLQGWFLVNIFVTSMISYKQYYHAL